MLCLTFTLTLDPFWPRTLNQRSLLKSRNVPLVGWKQQFHKASERIQDFWLKKGETHLISLGSLLFWRETGAVDLGEKWCGEGDWKAWIEEGLWSGYILWGKQKKAEEGLPLYFNAVLPSPIKIEAEWTHIAKVCHTWTTHFMERIFF